MFTLKNVAYLVCFAVCVGVGFWLNMPKNKVVSYHQVESAATAPDDLYRRRQAVSKRLIAEGRSAYASGNIDLAIHRFRDALRETESVFVRLDIASILERSGRYKEAFSEYSILFEDSRYDGSYRSDPTILNRYADLADRVGDTRAADRIYAEVLRTYTPLRGGSLPTPKVDVKDRSTTRATAKVIDGLSYGLRADVQQAMSSFTKATQIKPDFALAHLYLGVTKDRLNQKSAATESFRQAMRFGNAEIRIAAGKQRSGLKVAN